MALDTHRTHRNGAERHALRSRADDVISDFAELRRDVSRLADAATKAAKSEMTHATNKLHTARESVVERARNSAGYVSQRVRERPAAAIGITLGAGLVIGMLMSSARRH